MHRSLGMAVICASLIACAAPGGAPRTGTKAQAPREDGWPHESSERPRAEQFVRALFLRRNKGDRGRWVVQTSVRELRHPETGVAIVFLSVMHIAKPGFYRSLESHIEHADIVLEELERHRDPSTDLPEWVTWHQREMKVIARLLELVPQRAWETRIADERFVFVDLPAAAVIREQGDLPVSSKRRAWIVRWEKLADGTPEEFAVGRHEASQSTVGHASNPQLEKSDMRPSSVKREQVMFEKLKEIVDAGEHQRIAFVVGAAHPYFLEPRVTEELGFRHFATSWHDVFVYEHPAPEPESVR